MSAISTWHPARGTGASRAAERPVLILRRGSRLGRWMLVAVGVATILSAAWWVSRSAVFDLRTLRVEGVERVSPAEVARLSGLTRDTNVLWMSRASVERRLERSQWILDATLSRHLPGTITIRVRERVPVAMTEGRRPLLLAADGMLLGAARSSTRLPVVGAPRGLYRVGQRIPVSPELAVAAVLPAELRPLVASVARDPEGALILKMRDGILVLFGDASDVRAKAEAAHAVLGWAARHGVHATYVDVRAPAAPAVGTAPVRSSDAPLPQGGTGIHHG